VVYRNNFFLDAKIEFLLGESNLTANGPVHPTIVTQQGNQSANFHCSYRHGIEVANEAVDGVRFFSNEKIDHVCDSWVCLMKPVTNALLITQNIGHANVAIS
jgi:hypothetical protein